MYLSDANRCLILQFPLNRDLTRVAVYFSDFPSEPNTYVEQALDTLIEPVVAGVSKLRATSQISAISMSVNAMCEAWTAHILKQKMRFRWVLLPTVLSIKFAT